MKTCPDCRRVNDDEAKKCHECGAELGISEKSATLQDQVVPKVDDESFSTRVKWCYWFAAWGGAILVVLAINPAYILTAPVFPVGLFALFPNGDDKAIVAWGTGGFIVGWLFYGLLSILMFITKKKGIFFILYIIFCILLALNIGGCQRILKDVSHIQ